MSVNKNYKGLNSAENGENCIFFDNDEQIIKEVIVLDKVMPQVPIAFWYKNPLTLFPKLHADFFHLGLL